MFDPQDIESLVASHAELTKVCQAQMAVILKHKLLQEMAIVLNQEGVEEGFAARADAAQQAITRQSLLVAEA